MEIVVAPGVGGGSQVKVFDSGGKLKNQFLAYGKKYNTGIKIAVGNIYGRAGHNRASIIVAPQSDSEPYVKIFDNNGKLERQFLAYEAKFKNGLSLAAGDLNSDGLAEIITGVGPGGAPHARVFNGRGDLIDSFYAYPEKFSYGINVGFFRFSN